MSELPKQELLVKLLGMTTSSNDGEALVAMRKANALLASAGWDWAKLIAGKIRVVADPFATAATPPTGNGYGSSQSAPARPAAAQPAPAPTTRQTYPQQPSGLGSQQAAYQQTATQVRAQQAAAAAAQARATAQAAPQSTARVYRSVPINATRKNAFPGNCYCCGDIVDANGGLLFHPDQFTPNAPVGFKVACTRCNSSPNITIPSKARRPRVVRSGASTLNVGDLA